MVVFIKDLICIKFWSTHSQILLISFNVYNNYPYFTERKLRIREVNSLVQGQMASKWQSFDLKQVLAEEPILPSPKW